MESHLSSCGYPDESAAGGLRIFPGRVTPSGPLSNVVTVRATLSHKVPANAGMRVWFKSFDVNDPTELIHKNHYDDIRKTDEEGKFSDAIIFTNGSDIVETILTVTMQPGDNFKVFASTNQQRIDGLTDDKVGETTNKKGETADEELKPFASERLTVWRKVHIEVDSMGPVTGNAISGMITNVAVGADTSTVTTDQTLYEEPTAANRFEKGILRDSAGNRFEVISNTEGENLTVTVDTASGTIPVSGSFSLADDDDFNHDDYDFLTNTPNPDGDDGEDVGEPVTSIVEEKFAYAYVRPEYDIGGNSDVAFVLNSPTYNGKELLPETYEFENIGTEDDRDFWTIYLLGAYQPHTDRDADPFSEVATDKIGTETGMVDDIGKEGGGGGGKGASIFKETQSGEQPYILNSQVLSLREAHTVVHEIGHLFGGIHDDGGIMGKGEIVNTYFKDVTLKRIRNTDCP